MQTIKLVISHKTALFIIPVGSILYFLRKDISFPEAAENITTLGGISHILTCNPPVGIYITITFSSTEAKLGSCYMRSSDLEEGQQSNLFERSNQTAIIKFGIKVDIKEMKCSFSLHLSSCPSNCLSSLPSSSPPGSLQSLPLSYTLSHKLSQQETGRGQGWEFSKRFFTTQAW